MRRSRCTPPTCRTPSLLDIGGGLRVVHTPGHSPGHVPLLHEPTRGFLRRLGTGQRAGQRVRTPRRLPNDSIVVALRVGAPAARDRAAVAWLAEVFLVAAFFVVVFVAGARPPVALPAGAFLAAVFFAAGAFFATVAFFAAVAFAVGRRVGLAVAETAFLRAVRAEVAAAVPAVALLLVALLVAGLLVVALLPVALLPVALLPVALLPVALRVAVVLVAALRVVALRVVALPPVALAVVLLAAAVPDRFVAGLVLFAAVRDAAPVFLLIAAWAIVAPRVCRGRSGRSDVRMVERVPPAARADTVRPLAAGALRGAGVVRCGRYAVRVAKTITLSTYSPRAGSNRPPQVISRSPARPPGP
ncbi:hypothetical protein ACIBMZ_29895 [Micromonospora sp. NPDC049900]|uniref:hypothetical protein n=1 Tax=Micromonospora sp. NPDC049900 TaxID=3364275 RepID=UPI0037B35D8F